MGLRTRARLLPRIVGANGSSAQICIDGTSDVGDKIGLVLARHSAIIVYPRQACISWGKAPEPYVACFATGSSA